MRALFYNCFNQTFFSFQALPRHKGPEGFAGDPLHDGSSPAELAQSVLVCKSRKVSDQLLKNTFKVLL